MGSHRRRKPLPSKPNRRAAPITHNAQKLTTYVFASLALGLLTGGLAVYAWLPRASTSPQQGAVADWGNNRYPNVAALMAMSDAELGGVDPVVVNLAVARGIPAYADLNVERYVKTIDDWAKTVKFDTDRHRYRFEQNPSDFNNSFVEYRIEWLATDVNAVFKIDYDVLDFDFTEPSNLFLNGIVDRKLGTCVSMPMLYVALGWRLGYPIKPVAVPTHIFARWDDGRERINIEATGYGADQPDSAYQEEFFLSSRCIERGGELTSLTPRQTLAMLLLARQSYWAAIGDAHRSLEDTLRANLLYPDNPLAISTLESAWIKRASEDDYYRHAVEHLASAAQEIDKRRRANREKPIEKLVADDTGRPVRVHVDPATGKLTKAWD